MLSNMITGGEACRESLHSAGACSFKYVNFKELPTIYIPRVSSVQEIQWMSPDLNSPESLKEGTVLGLHAHARIPHPPRLRPFLSQSTSLHPVCSS